MDAVPDFKYVYFEDAPRLEREDACDQALAKRFFRSMPPQHFSKKKGNFIHQFAGYTAATRLGIQEREIALEHGQMDAGTDIAKHQGSNPFFHFMGTSEPIVPQ
jgi:hypothetical protein